MEFVSLGCRRVIFDYGTGSRPLGTHLMATAKKLIEAAIVLSHARWDQIQGFPFLVPPLVPGNVFIVIGAKGVNATLPEVLAVRVELESLRSWIKSGRDGRSDKDIRYARDLKDLGESHSRRICDFGRS